jgi:hypothetical protein
MVLLHTSTKPTYIHRTHTHTWSCYTTLQNPKIVKEIAHGPVPRLHLCLSTYMHVVSQEGKEHGHGGDHKDTFIHSYIHTHTVFHRKARSTVTAVTTKIHAYIYTFIQTYTHTNILSQECKDHGHGGELKHKTHTHTYIHTHTHIHTYIHKYSFTGGEGSRR